MRYRQQALVLALVGCLSYNVSHSQNEYEPIKRDTTSRGMPRANFASAGFDKSLTTYEWAGFLSLDKTTGPFSFLIDEQFRSTIIASQTKSIRDEQKLNAKGKYNLFDGVSTCVRMNSFVLSDDQKFADGGRPSVNRASSHAFYASAEVEPLSNLFLEPLLGMKYDNQVGVADRGISLAVGAWSRRLPVTGYDVAFDVRFQHDWLQPRVLEKRAAELGIGKRFSDGSRDSLQLLYTSNQRDFYFPADTTTGVLFNVTHNIERRIEHAVTVSNLLEFSASDRLMFSLQGALYSRTVDQSFRYRPLQSPLTKTLLNTDVAEFKLGGAGQVSYKAGDEFGTTVQFMFTERDERHAAQSDDRILMISDNRQRDETKKDNVSRRTSLASNVYFALSPSDRVQFSGSTSLQRYDTPSDENVDDRDELWYSLRATTSHQISRLLDIQFTADVNLMHLVYLFKERSANNAWNRIFRFAPRLNYVPAADFQTINTFEVLANYTVYDFENNPAVQVQSYSFRQFGFMDTTRIRLTRRVDFLGLTHIRLYQRGELRWDVFKERPVNYFEDKTFIGQLQYRLDGRLLFSVGLRYFSQARYGYPDGVRTFESILKSVGPLAAVYWEVGRRTRLAIDGQYESQTMTNSSPRSFVNMTMSIGVQL